MVRETPLCKFAFLLCYAVLAQFLSLHSCLAQSYSDELIAEAHKRRLAEERVWQVILHYRPRLFSQVSLNDDPTFFLAPDGKRNPQSELDATIRAFFSPVVADQEHAQCRFVARYRWLKRQLLFDSQQLPEHKCDRYEEWLAALDPIGITLIYPASYLNNPASMFGHTLLRIDAKGQDERTRMLAYSANYGAATSETSGLLFAIRGLTGGYKGSYSISPYYKRIKKYSDIEHRDIWEYQLNFSAEEARRLTELLWELGSSYFDYFFFDENCSYYLLYLLEYVRPELRLHEQFPFWAIPIDTVRSIAEVPGLLQQTHFRPSAATVLRHQILLSTFEEQTSALRLSSGDEALETSSFSSDQSKARVLELAGNYLEYRLSAEKGEAEQQKKIAYQLLRARSALSTASPFPPVPRPEVSPEQGHDTARIGAGIGAEESQLFAQYEYRPALHDFLDPLGGYVPGAQIDFMNLTLRQYEGRGLELERITPIAIRSVSARDRFIKPISWSIATGVSRRRVNSTRGTYAFEIDGGPGLAYEPLRGTRAYALTNISLEYSSGYDSGGFSGGLGGLLGLSFDLPWSNRILAEVEAHRFAVGQDSFVARAELGWSVSVSRSVSLRASWSREPEFGRYYNQMLASLYVYL